MQQRLAISDGDGTTGSFRSTKCNFGYIRPHVAEAIVRQANTLDETEPEAVERRCTTKQSTARENCPAARRPMIVHRTRHACDRRTAVAAAPGSNQDHAADRIVWVLFATVDAAHFGQKCVLHDAQRQNES